MERAYRSSRLGLPAVALALLLLSCATAPDLVGSWREIGKTASLEFFPDGSFKAVDNQGLAVSGKYARLEYGRVRFEVLHPGSSTEIVEVKISVQGDELTIFTERSGEVEKYKRLKP